MKIWITSRGVTKLEINGSCILSNSIQNFTTLSVFANFVFAFFGRMFSGNNVNLL